jgi:mRNA interferase HigB
MLVTSRRRLREFWEAPGHEDAQGPLLAWYKVVKTADWANFGDVRETDPKASPVGNCVVFNIGGNKYRLIARVIYAKRRLYVLRIMTHEEYDRNLWPEQCGCHQPPPKPGVRPTKGATGEKKKKKRKGGK